MITYNEQKTKDDRLFLNHARKALGEVEFNLVMDDARKAYQSHSRPSEAKRAANLVILAALKEIGAEHWRQNKDEKAQDGQVHKKIRPQKIQQANGKTASGTKQREGESLILQMADNNLKKQTGSNKI